MLDAQRCWKSGLRALGAPGASRLRGHVGGVSPWHHSAPDPLHPGGPWRRPLAYAACRAALTGACLHSHPCLGCGAWLVRWHSSVRYVARRSDALQCQRPTPTLGLAMLAPHRARVSRHCRIAALVSLSPALGVASTRRTITRLDRALPGVVITEPHKGFLGIPNGDKRAPYCRGPEPQDGRCRPRA